MNTELMFSSKTELWATPQKFYDKMNTQYNFTLDVCAIPENAKCSKFFTPEIDGLKQDWTGTCWMNPPYGRGIIKWVKKAYEEALIKKSCMVVALLPARTDTIWFHNYIYKKENVEIELIKGRLKFGDGQNSAPFPSMVAVFNNGIK
jgi:phage N-6-adenine-methyltransferase